MTFAQFTRRTRQILSDHKPVLLTSAGIMGTVCTALLAGKAGFDAGYQVAQTEALTATTPATDGRDAKTRFKDRTKQTWKLYLPTAASGVATIGAIAAAQKVNSNRTAALAAVYNVTQTAFNEYKAKAVEVLGEKKEKTAIRDSLAKERIAQTGERSDVFVLTEGAQLCYDYFSDRYFQSTMEDIKKAMNDTQYEIANNLYVSLNEFYSRLGLAHIPYGDEVGWTSGEKIDLHFTSIITPKERTALAIQFHEDPSTGVRFRRVNG